MSKDDIYNLSLKFHSAITGRDKNAYKFSLLSLFPNNCCEFSSLLLAKYIVSHYPEVKIKIVCGESLSNESERHIWLNIAGMVIDITASQFCSTLPGLLFEKNSRWHERFRIISALDFDRDFMSEYGEPEKEEIESDYKYLHATANKSPNN